MLLPTLLYWYLPFAAFSLYWRPVSEAYLQICKMFALLVAQSKISHILCSFSWAICWYTDNADRSRHNKVWQMFVRGCRSSCIRRLNLPNIDQKWISVKLRYHCIQTSASPAWNWTWLVRDVCLKRQEVSSMLITHWNEASQTLSVFALKSNLDRWLNSRHHWITPRRLNNTNIICFCTIAYFPQSQMINTHTLTSSSSEKLHELLSSATTLEHVQIAESASMSCVVSAAWNTWTLSFATGSKMERS